MAIPRREPFGELRRVEEMVDRLWRGLAGPVADSGGAEGWAIPLDVRQDSDRVVVSASLPGVKPEEIEVTVDEGVLAIKAQTGSEREVREGDYLLRERRSGAFYRSLRLPEAVDPDRAESRYEHGVLTISFPKREEKRARRLTISVGGGEEAPGRGEAV